MKTFQSFQKNSPYLGISSNQMQKNHSFNVKIVFGLIFMGFASISNIYFLCMATDSISENMFSVYMASLTVGVSFAYSCEIWKMKSLFKFINGIEKSIDSSKRNFILTFPFLCTQFNEINFKSSIGTYIKKSNCTIEYLP